MSKKSSQPEPVAKPKKKDLTLSVTEFLKDNNDKQFNYKQIAAAIDVRGEEGRKVLVKVLDKLRDEEILLESSRGRFRINNRGLMLDGRFERRSNGKNFFVPDDDGNIIYIPERNSKHAMNGDRGRLPLLLSGRRFPREQSGAMVRPP